MAGSVHVQLEEGMKEFKTSLVNVLTTLLNLFLIELSNAHFNDNVHFNVC